MGPKPTGLGDHVLGTNGILNTPVINKPSITGGTSIGVTHSNATLAGTTTNSGTISGGTVSGTTLSGTTTNSGTVSGGTLSGNTVTGGTIDNTVIGGTTPASGTFRSLTAQLAFTSNYATNLNQGTYIVNGPGGGNLQFSDSHGPGGAAGSIYPPAGVTTNVWIPVTLSGIGKTVYIAAYY